jgi:hypothetical protein
MSGLKQIKDSAGKAIASKLLPEIIGAFRVFDTLEDKDIQVPIMLKFLTNRIVLAIFSLVFPADHENKGEQLFLQERSP